METGKKIIVGAAGAAGAGLVIYGLSQLLKPPPVPPEGEPVVEVSLSWD